MAIYQQPPSDGHGAWQSEGDNFKTSLRKLLFDSTGAYIRNADLHEQLTVAKSTGLSGTFTITVTFFNAGPPLCSSGTLSGQRMLAN